MKKYPKNLIIIFILLITFNSYSQNNDRVVEGIIYDAETGKPLPYVHIRLAGYSIGSVTNENGFYKLYIPDSLTANSLIFSHIGYTSKSIRISSLIDKKEVELSPDVLELQEIGINSLSALQIIQNAIKRRNENYFVDPFVFDGFYRLTAKEEKEYLKVSEAVFSVFKDKNNDQSQFKLVKNREIQNEKKLNGIEIGIKAQSVMELDWVNQDDNMKNLVKDHEFELERIIQYQGNPVYEINFDQKSNLKKSAFSGNLLIDTTSFAIYSLKISRSQYGLKYFKFGNGVQRPGDTTQIQTNTSTDFVITNVTVNPGEKFTEKETLGKNQWIERQEQSADPLFWKSYNIIPANEDLNYEFIFDQISLKNKQYTLKNSIETQLRKKKLSNAGLIDYVISEYNQSGIFNGNVLVDIDGKSLIHKSYNNDLTDVNLDSRFRIGSLSKTFTSTLIFMMVKEGKLSLEESISSYLPEFQHKNIKIKDLLAHRSGLPDFRTDEAFLMELMERKFYPQEILEYINRTDLLFEPGTSFSYSNLGYNVLYFLIEKVSGKSYQSLLKEKILTPLQMNETYFGTNDMEPVVDAYLYNRKEPKSFSENFAGAGGISSTAGDLQKWSRSFHQNTLIDKETFDLMTSRISEYRDWNAYYGYGWMLDRSAFTSSKKHLVQYHPGTDLGFQTMLAMQPDKGITIILLCNTGEFPLFDITELILNILN